MQASSYTESTHPRLKIHVSPVADEVKARLLSAWEPSAAQAERALVEITGHLLDSLAEQWTSDTLVPVVVLRGGLLMLSPFREAFGSTALGVVVPTRHEHREEPTIAYGAIPVIDGARYVLLDVLVASGRTARTCLDWMGGRLAGTDHTVEVVAPFVATTGRDQLLRRHPAVTINCIWHAEDVDDVGRMRGPGFDIGDCALGHFGSFATAAGSA